MPPSNQPALLPVAINPPSYQLDAPGVALHGSPVDIVVCVHNALTDVQHCLAAIVAHTTPPYQLILVDDGSAAPTQEYLSAWVQQTAQTHPAIPVLLLRNETARGYTCAANQGMQAADSEALILLNSDTIVTPWWLDRLVACAESDAELGMVGPLSNTASWQSIPEIAYRGDWASNPLPLDMQVAQMGARIAALSVRLYPRLPFLNGFCLLIKRALIAAIGYFDEAQFAQGYGEENDYCLRAAQAGWSLAVADDVYIYHAQSKSYSHTRRKQLAERAHGVLVAKHGAAVIDAGVAVCRDSRLMQALRIRAKQALERWNLIEAGQYRWGGKRILFVLPVTDAGGGGNVVIAEAGALRRMGVDACLVNFQAFRTVFERSYPHLAVPVIYVADAQAIPAVARDFDAVIATANHSVEWLTPLANQSGKPVLGYYIQDFEPYFFVEKPAHYAWFWRSAWLRRRFASYYFRRHAGFRRAWLSYVQLPQLRRFTKTAWTHQELAVQLKQPCAVIGASCDLDLFMPRFHQGAKPAPTRVRVTAMIRPSSSRRGALRTMQVLRKLAQEQPLSVEILLFGVAAEDPQFLALPRDFPHQLLGLLTPPQVALLFAQADIFIDFSNFQAMGLTAMEAMAAGLAVIVPESGGSHSFAMHQKNALVIDTTDLLVCYQALLRLVQDDVYRASLIQQALHDINVYHPEGSALRLLKTLFA